MNNNIQTSRQLWRSAAIVSAGWLMAATAHAGLTLNAADYGVQPNSGQDATEAVYKLLQDVKSQGADKVIFPKGQYDFYATMAAESYTFISNNDEGLKRIIFNLDGFEDLVIDGQGADFMFHGPVNAFVLQDAEDITLKNFSIDYSRSFHSEGEILAVGDGFMDLHIPEQFPYKIDTANVLKFVSPNPFPPGYQVSKKLSGRKTALIDQEYKYKRLLEYDVNTRATPYLVTDIATGENIRAKKIAGDRNVRIFHSKLAGTVGNIMTFSAKYRRYPGIVVSDSKDVVVDNVTIYHAGGMGLLGQRSHNITVQNSAVTPSEGRIVSATADATHFNNCTGKIHLINNLFENQQDDATNIHGIYSLIDRVEDDKTLLVRLQHPQQYGFDYLDKGDKIEFVHGPSMTTYDTNKVVSVQRINKEATRITFKNKLHKNVVAGDSIAEIRDYPEILIKGNTIHRNRARGMLLNCRGKTVVEDNYFRAPGAALLFEGDAYNWFEQGGVRDVTIRRNEFDNSHYSNWGKAVIAVAAGISEEYKETARYNKNITIEDNVFKVYDESLILDIFSADGLRFRNNRIIKTDDFPARKDIEEKFFRIQYSDNVEIEDNNEFVGF